MRFQPGQPNSGPEAVARCQFENQLLLAYCSGNNLIILGGGELLQTVYLPSDGLALDINGKTGAICVALDNSVVVFELKKSYHRGSSWALEQTVPAKPVSCSWVDSQLLVVENNSVWIWGNKSVLWSENFTGSQCLVSKDNQSFLLVANSNELRSLEDTKQDQEYENSYKKHIIWSRVSQSAFSFDFGFISTPPLCWARWAHSLLFIWAVDNVLRAYKQLPCGIYEIVVSLPLPYPPIIIETPGVCYILYGRKTLSLISLPVEEIIIPRYVWKNVPLGPHSVDLAEMVDISSVVGRDISVLVRKKREILVVSVPLSIIESSEPPKQIEITLAESYTGHAKSIRKIARSSDGYTLFTQSRQENFTWRSAKLPSGETTLKKQLCVPVQDPDCVDIYEFSMATYALGTLTLWDISGTEATKFYETQLAKVPLVLYFLQHRDHLHLLAVYPERIAAWRVNLASEAAQKPLESLKDSFLPSKIHHAAMIDPVGYAARSNDRDVLSTVSDTHIQAWSLDPASVNLKWIETSSLELDKGTDPSHIKIKMSSCKRLAASLGNRLVIWDAQNQVVEFDKIIQNETVNDLDWTMTPTGDCLLGVGYSSRVVIYCRRRYDYTVRLEAWTAIRELEIKGYTDHEIGDSIWLKDGTFVIGAGNQLFIQGAKINVEDDKVRSLLRENNTISSLEQSSTLFDINAALNGPLPVYHPQFLIQLIFTDQIGLAGQILCHLLQQLKYAQVIEPSMVVEIDYWLGLDLENLKYTESPQKFDYDIAGQLERQLQSKALAYLTRHQQMTLLSVVQSLAQISQSLDTSGAKFMLGFHLFRLHIKTQKSMNMRDFVWGSISDCKQVLSDAVENAGATRSLEAFTQYGLMFWLEHNALEVKAEELAKRLFATSRDPVKVTLLYTAMRKKALLLSLWRISSGHPERDKTMKLLSNDFETPRWKAAALKNAYALMSKHRYEYAAALFLLGGACQDAVNILARQLNNLPLAFLVARLYDGDDGPVMKYLIDRFLGEDAPQAVDDDIYSHRLWMRVWAFMTTGDIKEAVKSATTTTRSDRANHTITDPVLLWVYKYLRKKSCLSPYEEEKVIKRTSAIYCRMGCDLIAVHASAEWKFNYDMRSVTPIPSGGPSKSESTIPTQAPKQIQRPTTRPPPTQPAPAPTPAPQAAQFDLSAFGF